MQNCIVPAKNLLGAEGEGFKIAMKVPTPPLTPHQQPGHGHGQE